MGHRGASSSLRGRLLIAASAAPPPEDVRPRSSRGDYALRVAFFRALRAAFFVPFLRALFLRVGLAALVAFRRAFLRVAFFLPAFLRAFFFAAMRSVLVSVSEMMPVTSGRACGLRRLRTINP